MGQKTHPIGFRLGTVKEWNSVWFTDKKFGKHLQEDELIRKYIHNRMGHAAISRVVIERTPQKMTVVIYTARPGVVIGRKGQEVDKLRDELAHLSQDEIFIKIEEVKTPELDAQLVADGIAFQLEQRVSFRRAMKKAVTSAMRMGAEGVKIIAGGRLGGAEIARSEGYHEGRVPLHTIRANIDYATSTANTTFGTIGVKVWLCKGEIIRPKQQRTEKIDETAAAR